MFVAFSGEENRRSVDNVVVVWTIGLALSNKEHHDEEKTIGSRVEGRVEGSNVEMMTFRAETGQLFPSTKIG